MDGVLCKPMMMDCLSCKKSKDRQIINGGHFCFDKGECTVPYAIVKNGRIVVWANN